MLLKYFRHLIFSELTDLILCIDVEVGSEGLQLQSSIEVVEPQSVQSVGVEGVGEARLIAGDDLRKMVEDWNFNMQSYILCNYK